MSDFFRFAVYYLPPDGPLARFGATWLGWDIAKGVGTPQFDLAGIEDVTATPRKYGFHATLKPPFQLSDGQTVAALEDATSALAGSSRRVVLAGLQLHQIGAFLALTPTGDTAELSALAARCVSDLDPFRTEHTADEIARRRRVGLTPAQDTLLRRWGYPYVMEEFQFHMTLSGALEPTRLRMVEVQVQAHLPDLPTPFVIDQIALVGERHDGWFELIQRYTLSG